MPDAPAAHPATKPLLFAVAVGVAVGLGVFVAVAAPIYMVRAIDLAGDARTFVRNGVLRGAVPAGAVAALLAGAVAYRWRRRGGRLAPSARRDSPGVTAPGGR